MEKSDNKDEYKFKQKCVQCLKGPKQIVRSVVLLICVIVVIYQIGMCMKKIRNPPIATYTHFDIKPTTKHPAITLCRDPPYKFDILIKYGLYGHPRFTSEWKYFNFEEVKLDDFWIESTYSEIENFIQYGLNQSEENISVKNTLHFILGQCQTIQSKINISATSKFTGYSFLLNHSKSEFNNTPSIVPPGYHVYIHQTEEPFAEFASINLMDYLYINAGEEVEIKLGLQQLNVLPGGEKNCEQDENYSTTKCCSKQNWDILAKTVGCSGPWMDNNISRCSNYSDMKDLIVNYIKLANQPDCSCFERCRTSIYSSYIVDRNPFTIWSPSQNKWIEKSNDAEIHTQLYIYFSNRMVSVYEELHSYDWSAFLADFGGSMGFLLGLSVLGIMIILEDIFDVLIKPFLNNPVVDKKIMKKIENDNKSLNSDYSGSINYNENIIKKYPDFSEKKIYI